MHNPPAQKETRHAETMLPDSAGSGRAGTCRSAGLGAAGEQGAWGRQWEGTKGSGGSSLGHANLPGSRMPPNTLPAVGEFCCPWWALPQPQLFEPCWGGSSWETFKRTQFGCTLEQNQVLKP